MLKLKQSLPSSKGILSLRSGGSSRPVHICLRRSLVEENLKCGGWSPCTNFVCNGSNIAYVANPDIGSTLNETAVVSTLEKQQQQHTLDHSMEMTTSRAVIVKKSDLLVEKAVGDFTLQDWRESEKILNALVNDPTVESVSTSLRLLDRLALELEEADIPESSLSTIKAILTSRLLNAVVRHWKDTKESPSTPEELLLRIEGFSNNKYPGFLTPNTRTYNMLMDGAIKRAENPSDGVQFAEALFHKMAKANSNNKPEDKAADTIAPNNVTVTTYLTAFSRAGEPQRAQQILDSLIEKASRQDEDAIHLDTSVFNAVLVAWAKSDNQQGIEECKGLLDRMHSLHQDPCKSSLLEGVKPNVTSYNIVLRALTKEPEMAESLLQRMFVEYRKGDKNIKPNVDTFNAVLIAWSKSGNVGAVERIFALMEQLHASGVLKNVRPDALSYSLVLDCWARSTMSGSVERTEAILRSMHRLAKAGYLDRRPDIISHSKVIKAWARNGNSERADQLLQRLVSDYRNGSSPVKPDRVTYNTVLSAWSKSKRPKAVARSEALLKEMQHLHETAGLDVKPDVYSYNSFLHCLARSNQRTVGSRASAILLEMEEKKKQGDLTVTPNVLTYSIVIHAFAQQGDAKNAERFLERMCESTHVQPNVQTFTTVISAWAKSTHGNRPEKAKALLKRLYEMHSLGKFEDVKPDVMTYNAVIDCWAGSERRDAGHQAEAILDEMEQLAKQDPSIKPNADTYNTVIKAWARASGDGRRAEAVFDRMCHKYVEGGDSTLKPDVYTLSTVIGAWSKPKKLKAAEKALEVLNRMRDPLVSGFLPIAPDVTSYNVILNCVAQSGDPKAGAFAEDLLREMERLAEAGDSNAKPDTISYGTVINAWVKSGNMQRAESLLEEMCNSQIKGNSHIPPSLQSFNTVLSGWANSGKRDALAKCEALLDRMEAIGQLELTPDVVTYNILLHCIAKSKDFKKGFAIDRAQAILSRMKQDRRTEPDLTSFNTLIAIMARQKRPERAEEVLQQLLRNDGPKPNTRTFNAVLLAWAKSGHSDAVKRCNTFLQEMQVSDDGINPDVVSFNITLDCIANSRRKGQGEEAENILNTMDRMYKGGKSVAPNRISFETAINACIWDEDLQRAQQIFERMFERYEKEGESMKPTWFIIRGLLAALSKDNSDCSETTANQLRKIRDSLYPPKD